MSRDASDYWSEKSGGRGQARDSDRYGTDPGRRGRRGTRVEDGQLPLPGSGYPDQGYGTDYASPGYADPGQPGPGYAAPGFADPGYADAAYEDSEYPGSGYVDPAGANSGGYPAPAGHGGTGYDGAGDGYGGTGYNGAGDGYAGGGYGGGGYGGRSGDRRGYGGGAGYDGGTSSNGAYDSGAYDSGAYDSGAYDSGAYDSGAYDRRRAGAGAAGGAGAGGYPADDYESDIYARDPGAYGGGYDDDFGQQPRSGPYRQYQGNGPGYGVAVGDASGPFGWQDGMDDADLKRGRRGRPSRDGMDGIDADNARHNGFFSGFPGEDDDRPAKRGRGRAAALIAVLVLFAAIGGGGYYGYTKLQARHANYTGDGTGSVIVQVKPGDTADELAPVLLADGVIKAIDPFDAAAKDSGKANLLEPGFFRLHKHMNATLAWDLLINPSARVQTTVAVPDGLRATKIIALLAQKTGIPLAQFQTALKDTSALGLPSWAKGNPEGFLWPATYNFNPGTSALTILQTMVKQANTEFASMDLAAAAQKAEFTEYQVIIEASLLEAEVGPQYFTKVARVIDNRLNAVPQMDLGLDSTVAYITNTYIYNLTQKDLDVNSPYNTMNHAGLPPGPIDSPDEAAIQAVLHPAKGDWLYFVTVNKSGLTEFTDSNAQFQVWSNEAKQNGL